MKRMTLAMVHVTLLLSLIGLMALTSCVPANETPVTTEVAALSEDSGEATSSAEMSGTLFSLPAQSITQPSQLASPEVAAQAASTPPATFFKPAGCLTTTKVANVVTYEFKGCTGPFGLVSVNGKLVATFTPASSSSLAVSVKSDGLIIGNTAVQYTATGSIGFSGTQRLVSWNGQSSGVLARSGAPINHQGSYSGIYDVATGCIQLDGNGITKWGIHGLQTKTTGYKRCVGTCPTDGTITATGLLSKLTVTIDYLGNGEVELTTPKGKVYDFKMGWCAAN